MSHIKHVFLVTIFSLSLYAHKNYLVVDSGGMMGLTAASMLVELEKEVGPLRAAFDGVAGTSTGAIVAALIADGRYSAEDMVRFYTDKGPTIFGSAISNFINPAGRQASANLFHDELTRLLPQHMAVSNVRLTILTRNAETRKPFWFDSYEAQENPSKNLPIAQAVLASCSVSTLFGTNEVTFQDGNKITCVDAGEYGTNNPSRLFSHFLSQRLATGETATIYSIGTGFDNGALESVNPRIQIIRIEPNTPELDALSANLKAAATDTQSMAEYIDIGKTMAGTVEFKQMVTSLKKLEYANEF